MFGVLFVSSQLKVFAVKDSLDEPEVSDGDCSCKPPSNDKIC